jgi:hypothetical protein
MKRIKIFAFALLACLSARAQEDAPEMAKAFYANGKIYVVVAVIGLIFAGIITYLITLDRKISKLENKI